MYCLGVDLGGTAVKMGLFTTDGHLINKLEYPVETSTGPEDILDRVANAAARLMADSSAEKACCLGMGIPGTVEGSRHAIRCINLGWRDVPVSEILEARLNIPVAVANDANMAALGEYWRGAGRAYSCTVFVTLGTGIGGGLVEHGRVIEGSNGCGGEFGHMTLFPYEAVPTLCNCGKRGCLEQYAAAPGIVRQTRQALAASNKPSSLRSAVDLQAKDIFDAAKAGDNLALEIVDRVCFCLGVALANVSTVFDPEAFIIGGGISNAGSILTDAIRPYYKEHAYPGTEKAALLLASLGNSAGMYGAVRLALDTFTDFKQPI